MSNFRELIDLVYEAVGDTDDSTIYPINTIKELINSGQDTFIGAKIDWQFLKSKKFYTTIGVTTLAVDFTVGDIDIELTDATNLPADPTTEYRILIDGEVALWGNKTGNILENVSGLTVNHKAGATVQVLYSIPSDADKPARIKVDGKTYDYMDEESFEQYSNRFTIINNDWILLPQLDGGSILELPYFKGSVELVSDSDDSLIPAKYTIALAYYALGKLLLATDEISKARSYCYYNPNTLKYEGLFGEKLYEAMREYSVKTSRNKKRIIVRRRQQA